MEGEYALIAHAHAQFHLEISFYVCGGHSLIPQTQTQTLGQTNGQTNRRTGKQPDRQTKTNR